MNFLLDTKKPGFKKPGFSKILFFSSPTRLRFQKRFHFAIGTKNYPDVGIALAFDGRNKRFPRYWHPSTVNILG